MSSVLTQKLRNANEGLAGTADLLEQAADQIASLKTQLRVQTERVAALESLLSRLRDQVNMMVEEGLRRS
jgi:chromosome segregation ATPase